MESSVWLIIAYSCCLCKAFFHEIVARGDKVVATGRHAETTLAHLKDTNSWRGTLFECHSFTASYQCHIPPESFDQYGQIDVPVKQC